MEIDLHQAEGKYLVMSVGKEKLDKITDEIASIIVKSNLDATPSTLASLFNYIREVILIRRI